MTTRYENEAVVKCHGCGKTLRKLRFNGFPMFSFKRLELCGCGSPMLDVEYRYWSGKVREHQGVKR